MCVKDDQQVSRNKKEEILKSMPKRFKERRMTRKKDFRAGSWIKYFNGLCCIALV